MNKIYSKVWNKSLGMLVVASEFAKASGKGGATKRLRAAVAVAGIVVALSAAPALATDSSSKPTDTTTAGRRLTANAVNKDRQGAAVGSIAGAVHYLQVDGSNVGTDNVAGGSLTSVSTYAVNGPGCSMQRDGQTCAGAWVCHSHINAKTVCA